MIVRKYYPGGRHTIMVRCKKFHKHYSNDMHFLALSAANFELQFGLLGLSLQRRQIANSNDNCANSCHAASEAFISFQSVRLCWSSMHLQLFSQPFSSFPLLLFLIIVAQAKH